MRTIVSYSTAELLRSVWPTHTAKHAARAADVAVRTAKGWLAGREPSAATLLTMARRNDALRAEVAKYLGDTHASKDSSSASAGTRGGSADRLVGPDREMGETAHRPAAGGVK